jgi:ketosteroid isomerase-like protein
MRRTTRSILALAVMGCALGVVETCGLTAQAGNRTAAAVASAAPDEPSEAIRAVLATQQAAWNRGDIPAFLEGYWNSPELTFSGADGIVRGYAGLLQRYRKSYPDRAAMGELDFSELEIRTLAPDAALVLGHWHLNRAAGDAGGVLRWFFVGSLQDGGSFTITRVHKSRRLDL